jgi:hydroxymethylbilane synthase
MKTLRLGTRKSALAQAQARWTAERLRSLFPDIRVETVFITTSGDMKSEGRQGIGEGGLKALFTKEIEEALLDNRIDLAVHSLKDMSVELPKGLTLGAVPEREDPRDVWISRTTVPFGKIPAGAKIGTGAVRRQAQLKRLLPQAVIFPIRGNIDTRLRKLLPNVIPAGRKPGSITIDPPPATAGDDGRIQLDGIILALAGLRRLGFEKMAMEILPIDVLLPAIGQGCLGIQVRDRDLAVLPFMKALDHAPSRAAALAERAFLKKLGGSCQTPIAGHASIETGELTLRGLVISPDGQQMVSAKENGRPFDAEGIGERLAQKLLEAGADKILAQ